MENELIVGKKDMLSLIKDTQVSELIKPLQQEIFLFDTYIAGTTHIVDGSIFDELKSGDKLCLQREPDNRFDENAILVLDGKGRKLGYIPEKDNTVFTRLMDAGKMLTAKVDTCDNNGAFRKIGIGIYLVDF